MNPLTVVPEKARLWIYLLISIGVLAFSAWQAAEGNWIIFVGGLLVALQGFMSSSNTGESDSPFKV